ncbi:MAG: hypothetical protein AAGD38_05080 [Acidobacteriota bacterium]
MRTQARLVVVLSLFAHGAMGAAYTYERYPVLLGDGFESGDTSSWSSTVP